MKENRLLGNLALFMTALIWGLSFVAQREGMAHVGPFTFNMARSYLGALSLLPLIFWVKFSKPDTRKRSVKRYQHINLARAGIACGLALFIALTIQQYCMQFVSAGKGGFITALYIIFVPLIAILQGKKLQLNIIISVILAVIGLYLLCFQAGGGFGLFDLWLLVGAFFYGVHILVVNFYSSKVHPIKASCLQFLVVAILSTFLAYGFETPTMMGIMDCKVSILYAGILTCGGAYTLQIFGQKHTLPIVATLILSLESVFAVLGGVLILGETMIPKEILGCVFMITAVIISDLKFNKKFWKNIRKQVEEQES